MKTTKRTVGIIANPLSSRDIRRVVSCANTLQTSERANIVIRIIVALGYFGVDKVVMMPDRSGLHAHLERYLHSLKSSKASTLPEVEFIEMLVTESIVDTELAAIHLKEIEADTVVVLGGDGTHRAVAKQIGSIPIAGISTGTNNAFPRFYEATLVGLAISLYINQLVPDAEIKHTNKKVLIYVNGEYRDMALVDVAITRERWVGAKALWRMDEVREIFLSFCEPNAIGMSAVGGFIQPVSRDESAGLYIDLDAENPASKHVSIPIAPGLFEPVAILDHKKIELGKRYEIKTKSGVVAVDGEREIEFTEDEKIEIEISDQGPDTIAVNNAIEYAARNGLFMT